MLITLTLTCAALGMRSATPRGANQFGLSATPGGAAQFGFSAVFGDYMVLQQSPARAAVYGPMPTTPKGAVVTVTVASGVKSSYTVKAQVGKDATHQPFGYVDPKGTPLPVVENSWKALLRPTEAGGDYTITAKCQGCTNTTVVVLSHVTFGDFWYCSGQSNMWLPVQYTFSRNQSVLDIKNGKFDNIRGMFSPSATTPINGKWLTARQAIQDGNETHPTYSFFNVGATCWYFVQGLVERGVKTPIGIADTAIGGQRIEEFMNNKSYHGMTSCPADEHVKEYRDAWNGQLFAKQVMPFVDMTVKGWIWYQGENNMFDPKGNSEVNVGYSCKQRELVKGWRSIWSEQAGTTDPEAPFGVVSLASSGSEGGPNMGAMRHAQTAGYGVLPNNAIPNSFLAQAGDLQDAWGPDSGPCFSNFASQWGCCSKGVFKANRSSVTCVAGTNGKPEICDPACAASAGTKSEGGIHPRSKLLVGERLASAAFGLVYGGKEAITGPTISGCEFSPSLSSLTINFNESLLSGEAVVVNSYNSSLNNAVAPPPMLPANLKKCFDTVKRVCANHLHNYSDCRNCKTDVAGAWDQLKPVCGSRPINNFHVSCKSFFPAKIPLRGSLLEVLVGQDGSDGSAAFCVEPMINATGEYCPVWAGNLPTAPYNQTAGKWVEVDIVSAGSTSIKVSLDSLNGTTPVGIRYSWGIFDCCNTGDPTRYVSTPCDDACPITTSLNTLPANPFMARIIDGKCSCVSPQVC